MKKDAVIGVITNLKWEDLRPYAITLAKCGFAGDRLMFVNQIALDVRINLEKWGFTLIDYDLCEGFEGRSCDSQVDVAAWTGFGQWRYKPVIDYLEKTAGRYRYIIWTDVRDLMFQLDPIPWIEENLKDPYKLIAARECWLIGDQPHNAQWAKFTAPQDYEWLKKEEVLCVGSIAGETSAMLELFKEIFQKSLILDPRANDQGIFNWLLRVKFSDITIVPKMKGGFVATAWANKRYEPSAFTQDEPPVFNTMDYVVYTPDGFTPFCIVHQFDRDPNWKRCIELIMETVEKAS